MSKLALEIAHQMDAVAISPEHDFRDMEELVRAAKEFDLHLVYGLNCFYPYLLRELKGTHTIVGGGLVSASSGFESTEQKLFLAKLYQEMGCGEIDMYLNLPYLRSGMEDRALEELKRMREAVKCPLKVIIEAPLLTPAQIKSACEVVIASGADFIKTGTGFFGPTTLEIVRMVSDAAAGRIRSKAAGGIMGYETLKAMREMGVSRFGMGYKKVAAMLREL